MKREKIPRYVRLYHKSCGVVQSESVWREDELTEDMLRPWRQGCSVDVVALSASESRARHIAAKNSAKMPRPKVDHEQEQLRREREGTAEWQQIAHAHLRERNNDLAKRQGELAKSRIALDEWKAETRRMEDSAGPILAGFIAVFGAIMLAIMIFS